MRKTTLDDRDAASSKLSRRDLLKLSGSMALGAGLGGVLAPDSSKALASSGPGAAAPSVGPTPIIDIHRHCMPQPSSTIEELVRSAANMRLGFDETDAYPSVTLEGISSVIYRDLRDIDLQVQRQDEAGVTKSLLSFCMMLEISSRALLLPSSQVAKRLNDATAGLVARYPTKLDFMVMVNPFDRSSIEECERCLRNNGAKGISIGTSWKGRFLDSAEIDPFWEYAQDEGAPIFLHPPMLPIGHEKMNAYKLEEVVGRPFDTTMTISRMIYAGVFDRYPGLRVVLPHMGGGLLNVIGRLDFGHRLGYEGLPEGQAAVCKRRPSEYLKTNLYVDTMGFSAAGIRHCIEVFGADRVLFGTDYGPVPISPVEHIHIVKGLGLSLEDEAKIFWKNASDLFDLAV
jgi:aminocarboxymuconate-semialdehyde decarboxylase